MIFKFCLKTKKLHWENSPRVVNAYTWALKQVLIANSYLASSITDGIMLTISNSNLLRNRHFNVPLFFESGADLIWDVDKSSWLKNMTSNRDVSTINPSVHVLYDAGDMVITSVMDTYQDSIVSRRTCDMLSAYFNSLNG